MSKKLLRSIFNYFLLIVWCIVIIYFSSVKGNDSYKQSLFLVSYFQDFISYNHLKLIVLILRKIAHFSEYFILTFLAFNCFKSKKKAILFSLFFALSDELHQNYVAGRVMSFIDVLIDMLGSFTYAVMRGFYEKKSFEKKEKQS